MVGVLGFSGWRGFYGGGIGGWCVEVKDSVGGSGWEWIDWGVRVGGGSIWVLFWMIV